MGWWQRDAGVIGDPVADYMDALKDALGGIPWQTPPEIPAEVRERITSFYLQGLGWEPTEADLAALIAFARADR